jgi:hypothetical protein
MSDLVGLDQVHIESNLDLNKTDKFIESYRILPTLSAIDTLQIVPVER